MRCQAPVQRNQAPKHPRNLESGKELNIVDSETFYQRKMSQLDAIDCFFGIEDLILMKSAQKMYRKLEKVDLVDLVSKLHSADSSQRITASLQLLYFSIGHHI